MAKFTKLNIGDSVASGGGRKFRKLSTVAIPTEQLPQPYGVTIDGNTLTWGDYSALATNFDILVDGVVSANTTEQSFPLSYFGFSDGTYSISVVSKAEGYLDSEPSEAVEYVVGESIVGTWVFNDVLDTSTSINFGQTSYNSSASIIGEQKYYGSMNNVVGVIVNSQYGYVKTQFKTNSSNTFYINGWEDDTAKTITFNSNAESVTNYEAFFTWLKANATKQ